MPTMQDARLRLNGLDKVESGRSLKSALQAIGGVDRVVIWLDRRIAIVRFDPLEVMTEQLRRAARAVGCEVESIDLSAGFIAVGGHAAVRGHTQACVLCDPTAPDAQPALVAPKSPV